MESFFLSTSEICFPPFEQTMAPRKGSKRRRICKTTAVKETPSKCAIVKDFVDESANTNLPDCPVTPDRVLGRGDECIGMGSTSGLLITDTTARDVFLPHVPESEGIEVDDSSARGKINRKFIEFQLHRAVISKNALSA